MKRKNRSLEVASLFLGIAIREADCAACWMGHAKRTAARDAIRRALTILKQVKQETK